MHISQRLCLVTLLLCLPTCVYTQTRDINNLPAATDEQMKLYDLFLEGYLGKGNSKFHVSFATFLFRCPKKTVNLVGVLRM